MAQSYGPFMTVCFFGTEGTMREPSNCISPLQLPQSLGCSDLGKSVAGAVMDGEREVQGREERGKGWFGRGSGWILAAKTCTRIRSPLSESTPFLSFPRMFASYTGGVGPTRPIGVAGRPTQT